MEPSTRKKCKVWRGQDSNLRRPEGRRVYSPLPLTTRPPLHAYPAHETRTVLQFVEPFPLLEADLWPPSTPELFRISSTPLQTTTSKQDSILVRNGPATPCIHRFHNGICQCETGILQEFTGSIQRYIDRVCFNHQPGWITIEGSEKNSLQNLASRLKNY